MGTNYYPPSSTPCSVSTAGTSRAMQGTIFDVCSTTSCRNKIRKDGITVLNGLSDVYIDNLKDSHVLMYDEKKGIWTNKKYCVKVSSPILDAPCELNVPETFSTWCDTITTDVNIKYPKNDIELKLLLETAFTNNEKIRIVGATHSAGGIVTDGDSIANQTVVSLHHYRPPETEWHTINPTLINESKPIIRIPAGMTYLDLYQHIRPQCYFLPNQTAGFFFTIGGTVSVPVHGGVFGTDMINRYITRIRVMELDSTGKANSRIINYNDKYTTNFTNIYELNDWRSGFGLLGVITAVEFRLVKREAFKIASDKETINWNETEFRNLIDTVKSENIYAEFFGDLRDENEVTIQQVLFKKPSSNPPITWKCNDVNKLIYKTWYQTYQTQWPDIGTKGDKTIDALTNILKGLPSLVTNSQLVAGTVLDFGTAGTPFFALECATQVNDGFWVKAAPCATIMAYYCPASYDYEFVNATRTKWREHWEGGVNPYKVRFNQSIEWRYVTVSENDGSSYTNHGGPTLFNIPAGEWIVIEVLYLNGYLPDNVADGFADMETAWNNIPYNPSKPLTDNYWPNSIRTNYIPVIPHLGKNFSYSNPPFPLHSKPFKQSGFPLNQYSAITTSELNNFKIRREKADVRNVFYTPQSSWFTK